MNLRFLLSFLLITLSFGLQAQEMLPCEPDTTLLSDSVLISPLPFEADLNPEGGIKDIAVLDEPYETVFSLRMPDSLNLVTLQAAVIRAEFATSGAITGLPDGLSYACNPPDCVFEAGVTGCLVISGTPTNPENIGDNPLVFTGRVFLEGGFNSDLSFPDDSGALPESFVGQYIIEMVEEANSTNFISENVSISNVPNPFSNFTHIRVNSKVKEALVFTVKDFMGRTIERQQVNIAAGNNTLYFNAVDLPQGIYVYTLGNIKGQVSGKMILSRN